MKKRAVIIFLLFVVLVLVAAGILYLNEVQGYFMLSWPDFNEAYVSLRFDDGLKSQLNAVKLLNEYNMTASFYIIVEKPDSKIEWERQYYMNWDELRNISKGMETGSHTLTHADLLRTSDYKNEIILSKKILVEKGFNITTFVYPGGNYNMQVLREVEKEYDCASTQDVGTNGMIIRPHLLKDFTIRSVNDIDTVKRVVKKGKWNILTFHDVGEINGNLPSGFRAVAEYNSASIKFFREILDYLKNKNVKIISIEQGCEMFKNY